MTKQSDLLEAVSVADRVGELQFTVGQVCRMAGITKMQLDYWTERGSIPTQGKKQRLYDASSVETVGKSRFSAAALISTSFTSPRPAPAWMKPP